MKQIREYQDGRETGVRKEYYSNGTPKSEITGNINGKKQNGILVVKKKVEEFYKNGVLDSLRVEWYENGQMQSEANYINGKIDGIYKEWFPDGKQKLETPYNNGIINGTLIEWHPNGIKSQRGEYY
ncbi:MAG: hypothetical protein H6554_08905 [Chitinophagales bacterium]|nr:hypothetical protein [Chitinophagales bacterium]